MDDKTMIVRAMRALQLECARKRQVYMQPSDRGCRVQEADGALFVVLANGGGENILRVYRVDGNPLGAYILVGVAEWPAALSRF